jgi:hypothetical protein
MHGTLQQSDGQSISAPAGSCSQRHYPAEPLWFATMCREIYGANAPKDLQYQLGKSERTCRAWAAGDIDPASTIFLTLLRGDDGGRMLDIVLRDAPPKWWRDVNEDRRQAAIFRAAMREASV